MRRQCLTKTIQPHPGDRDLWLAGDEGVLRVTIFYPSDEKSGWDVTVWGPDDVGYELEGKDHDTAFKIYKKIKKRVTIADLKEMGFQVG